MAGGQPIQLPMLKLMSITLLLFIGAAGAQVELTIPSRFDQGLPFQEGMAAVRIGLEWGYIAKNGQFVV